MNALQHLEFAWDPGDNQDVISVRDRRRPDDWPYLELSPAEAIAAGQKLIEQGTAALRAYYSDGRAVADGRIPVPAGEPGDYFPVDEPIPLVPADPEPPEPLPKRTPRCTSAMPYIGRWSR